MPEIAWLFPGQGSQAVGMDADLAATDIGKDRFDRAHTLLGWSVPEACNGDETQLSRTLYTQPCLYTVETILVDLLRQAGREPDIVAGHSLGEYVALYAAGVFDFETGLKLVKYRSELMDSASGGQMIALMKFDRAVLENAIANSAEVVLANDNSDGQVVISGSPEAVDEIANQVQAKRAIKLNVSGAFHSPMMTEAAQQFQQLLETVTFADAKMPVVSNVEPEPTTSGTLLKTRLSRQMTGSVRWRETQMHLVETGTKTAVEVGPGKVLAGLMKRSFRQVTVENVSAAADI